MSEEQRFYENLYKSKGVDNTSQEFFFGSCNVPKLSQDQKESLEQPITINEISKAVKSMKNGKTPGSDGLTTDFYKFFWGKLKNLVYESICMPTLKEKCQ